MPRGVYPRIKVKATPTDRVVSVIAIDWPAMLTALEQQRAALDQDRADIDAVIQTIRRRAAPKVTIAAIRQTQRANGAKGKRLKRAATTSKVTDANWMQARHWWDAGMAGDEIGRKLHVTGVSVREHAKRHKWPARNRKYTSPPARKDTAAKRPNPGAAALPAAAALVQQPAGTQLSGSVKCTAPECGAWTDHDPCRVCGKPLKRKW